MVLSFVPLIIILFFGHSKKKSLKRLPKETVIVLAFNHGLLRAVMWLIGLYFSCHEIHMYASGPHIL